MKPYIKYSKRKTVAIKVDDTGQVVVNAPRGVCIADIDKLLLKNLDWIGKQSSRVRENRRKLYELELDPEKIEEYKLLALEKFKKMANEYSEEVGVSFKKFRLSNARTRWGSCSAKGTVSINWRLWFAPEELQRYVVLHEVVHLKHMNHSKRFWNEVSSICNQCKASKKELKSYCYLLLL